MPKEAKKRGRTGFDFNSRFLSPEQLRVEKEVWKDWLERVANFRKFPQVASLFHHRLPDNRPYIRVSLQGYEVLALLDSGASQTVIGREGLWLLDRLNLTVHRLETPLKLRTADNVCQPVLGLVELPISVDGVTRNVTALVSNSIVTALTLGSDCCYLFNLRTDFANDTYTVASLKSESKVIRDKGDLDPEQMRALQVVMEKFRSLAGTKLGRTNRVTHVIDTGDAKPIKQRYRPMAPAMLEVVNKEIDEMLELGVIRPSRSPWNSPIVMVKKKDGSLRFCFDGRQLNSVTKPDAYPLPYVSSILDRLGEARFLTSVDLKKAFWQIPLSEESCEKTAFTVPGRGLFEFTVLPFGLSNSPQTLQRLMDNIFGPEFDNVFVYLDDIVVASRTFAEHISTLTKVYERLKDANFTVNLEKCEFCRPSLTYLGYLIDGKGLRTDPAKVEAITSFPTPKNTTEIKRFMGMAGWYRRFIPNFSTEAAPILELLKGRKKGQQVKWTDKAEIAFQKLKQWLVSSPVLASPDFSKRFIIQCDASDVGVGAVLLQGEEDEEKVIAYASRSLTAAERNYSTTEKECLACLFGVEKFRPYVELTKFKIVTDHSALLWLHKLQSPSGRLARWTARLSQFTFEIVHRKGKFNVVPDALSRAPVPTISSLTFTVEDHCAWYTGMIKKIAEHPEKYPDWKCEDQVLYRFVANRHSVISNLVEWKMVVPKTRRCELFKQCHDDPTSAHLGSFKTYMKLCEVYYWPKMKQDVVKYVRGCKICQAAKSSSQLRPGFMGKQKKIQYPFQLISIDLIGPLPRSNKGNSVLLVVTDWFTKFVQVQPLRKATAQAIVKFLENEVFLMFGVPQIVMCDNGPQFVGGVFQKLMEKYKVQKVWYNASYHPQVNPVERTNRVIGTAIRSYVKDNHRLWDEEIYRIAHALRNAVHEVTGHTPSFLNFGRTVPSQGDYYGRLEAMPNEITTESREQLIQDINNTSDLYQDIVKRLNQAYEKNKRQYDLRKRPVKFKKGELVWKRNPVLSDAAKGFSKKLAPKFVMAKVAEVTGSVTYRLTDMNGKNLGVWHVKDLKPHHSGMEEDEH